ncbi:glucose 1-dehydrogenase [Nitrosomonas sp. Nm51]|uniref:SDR family oxidoreductase n=1 Tax=Nitrosomonas sp. Nm51 TaxID=133720 RepID=UPI0008B7FBEB|nr:SDR family oxidoreductase [Nitrosomonas sp. Nm51]SER75461.1 glucose 1-dehydrogenase [Nitrosomonas sp. Nm51]
MQSLNNKIVLITGAATGIGKAVALRFGQEGSHVIVNYLDRKDDAEAVTGAIKAQGGSAVRMQADISREDGVVSLFAAIRNQFGGLDVLVNNAGMQQDSDFIDMTLDDWNAVINVDLTGHFLCAREAARLFMQQSSEDSERSPGAMVFITSVHQNIPWSRRANYCAAKAGAAMLMKTVAQELAPYKIRVNAIAPGAIKTPINIENFRDPESRNKIMRKIPYGRPGKVEDIAAAAAWLASDEADYITGETIFVDGGMELFADFAHGG